MFNMTAPKSRRKVSHVIPAGTKGWVVKPNGEIVPYTTTIDLERFPGNIGTDCLVTAVTSHGLNNETAYLGVPELGDLIRHGWQFGEYNVNGFKLIFPWGDIQDRTPCYCQGKGIKDVGTCGRLRGVVLTVKCSPLCTYRRNRRK